MKKNYLSLLLPLLFLIVFSSCQKAGENDTMMSQKKDVVYKAMNAFDHGDADALDSLVTPDFVEHQVDTMHTKARGLDAVKEIFHAFHKAIPDLKTTIHAIAVTGDTVMVYNTGAGTLTDTLMGMPPTNSMMSFPGVDVFVVKNGKIAEHWGFADMQAMQAMQQMTMPIQSMPNKKKMK
jgi:steroid delta-isomerase-like uncharacterized protein